MQQFIDILKSTIDSTVDKSIETIATGGRIVIPSQALSIGVQEYQAPGTQIHVHFFVEFGKGSSAQTSEACISSFGPTAHEDCAHRFALQVLPLFLSLRAGRAVSGAIHIDHANRLIPGVHGFIGPIWRLGDKSTDVSEVPFFAGVPTPHPPSSNILILAKSILMGAAGRWELTNEINGHEYTFRINSLSFGAESPSKLSISTLFALYFFPKNT